MKEVCKCGKCGGDGPFYIHAACHPHDPVWAIFIDDTLALTCAVCGKIVVAYRAEMLPSKFGVSKKGLALLAQLEEDARAKSQEQKPEAIQ